MATYKTPKSPLPFEAWDKDEKKFVSDPIAKRKWAAVCKELHENGILKKLDLDAVYLYVVRWREWHKAYRAVLMHGRTTVTPNDYEVQSVYYTIMTKQQAQLVKMQVQLGLTPAARTRVQVMEAEAENALEELKRKRKERREQQREKQDAQS